MGGEKKKKKLVGGAEWRPEAARVTPATRATASGKGLREKKPTQRKAERRKKVGVEDEEEGYIKGRERENTEEKRREKEEEAGTD